MINVLSLFSGIGAFEKALKNIGVEFRIVNYCEIDKYASKVYSMLHNVSEKLNLNDVTEIDTSKLHDIDLITYGFPCQDISIAGKQKGFTDNKGNRTRSGLFFEALRIIEDTKPKYAIAENVKALTSKKFKNEFETVLNSLNNAGYTNYYAVLNAKDYGIPQNRERVFIVSIRRDVDEGDFQFPDKEPLMLSLRDMLEPTEFVDEKYYLSTEREGVRKLIAELEARYSINNGTVVCVASRGRNPTNPSGRTTGSPTEQRLEPNSDGCTNTLTTVQKDNLLLVAEPRIMQVGNIVDNPKRDSQCGRIYDPSGLAPTLNTVGGGGHEAKIVIDGISVIGQLKGGEKGRVLDSDGISYTLAATDYKDPVKIPSVTHHGIRIRKLTPKECFRLMGFSDSDFNSIKGISNTQLYKMAGNSIVVNVLECIFKQLFFKE